MTNRWKIAFVGLLTAILLIGIIFILLLFSDTDSDEEVKPPVTAGETVFTVRTTKERLNSFIQLQLDALTYDRESVDFTVVLTDDVHVNGYVRVFDHPLNFEMQLDPLVLDNGDLLLEQKSFYIGQLPVPKKQLLSFLDKNAHLPDWINIDANSEKTYVALHEITIGNGSKIKAKVIDLENNRIEFDVYIPE